MERLKRHKGLVIVLALFLAFSVMALVSWIPVTERVRLNMIDGNVRIALVTDLHSCYYGPDQRWLIERIAKESPDVILLGGDIFDDGLPDDNVHKLMESLVAKYPCYYVTGNHEFWSGRVDEMKAYMKSIGVTVLDGDCETITVNGVTIDVCGVDDPTYMSEEQWLEQLNVAYAKADSTHFRILLTHRPEKVDTYNRYDFDLILAGHAHAGQMKIPFINRGLLAPDQGFFAKYVDGLYTLDNGSVMEVSRGLSRESTRLPRFFNRPELVVIDLH